MNKVLVTQIRSTIKRPKRQVLTIQALGLGKLNKTVEKDGNEIIHRGISQRSFAKSFTIADDVKVNGAELIDGLLTINCEKIVPEQKKKKLIPIE